MDGVPTSVALVILMLLAGYTLLEVIGVADPGKALGPPSSGSPFIDALASAIAHAEGYYSNPLARAVRNNNPGDISDTQIGGVTAIGKDSGGLSIFANSDDGWHALYAKLRNIMSGGSTSYSATMSISELAYVWTGNDNPDSWANTVASKMSSAGWPATPDDDLRTVAA